MLTAAAYGSGGAQYASRNTHYGVRRAFTLIELLVVLALTAVLMLILFAPLSQSLDLTARANAKVAGQDNVREAMRRVVRDLSNAMEVYDPQTVAIYGFNAWTYKNKQFVPVTGAVPEAYLTRNTLIAFRLPKHRYYCTQADHYVTPQDIDAVYPPPRPSDDVIAMDTCPRHPGSPAELRPLSPLEPDDRITTYFVGLKNPAPAAGGSPLYENILLFRNTRNNALNTYALYRVEFDPRGVNVPGTATDGNGNGLDDRYETFPLFAPGNASAPYFFYDATPVTVTVNGSSQTKPRYQWWKDLTVSVMDAETSDVVRWVESGGKAIPHSLVSFRPGPSDDEVAQPNRNVGSFLVEGSALSSRFAPLEYIPDNGHWTGVPADGTRPIPDTAQLAPELPVGSGHGARIRILDGSNPLAMTPVFDTQTATRNRLVSFDSMTGKVILGIPRMEENAANPTLQESFSAPIDLNTFTTDLKLDTAVFANGMPSAFGSAVNRYGGVTRIVPGSESIQLIDTSGGVTQSLPFRRAGWSYGNTNTGEFVAQPDLAMDEYAIDYVTGIVTLSTQNPNEWVNIGPGQSRQLLIKYKIQTNQPTDVVRVSYLTRELASVHLGIVQYTRRRQEILPFEVSERVVIRNLKR